MKTTNWETTIEKVRQSPTTGIAWLNKCLSEEEKKKTPDPEYVAYLKQGLKILNEVVEKKVSLTKNPTTEHYLLRGLDNLNEENHNNPKSRSPDSYLLRGLDSINSPRTYNSHFLDTESDQ